ncbi:MAG: DNA gyrase inhibitor YacG [Gammaproteobacteria bacterium]|nr:MAG: DNA gyrase inhibitor YacG [Gammaproteobacteria bacterium]
MKPISNSATPTVRCPTCRKPVQWKESSVWRPFCSERCKLIDLGEWASENYRIPEVPTSSPDD